MTRPIQTPHTGLWTICAPCGLLIQTHVSTKPEEAISDFLDTESVVLPFINNGRERRGETRQCAKSWEQYEAEGYSVEPVEIHLCGRNKPRAKTYRERRELHICAKCEKPCGENWLCPDCKDKHNAKQRAASARRRAMGLYPPSRQPKSL